MKKDTLVTRLNELEASLKVEGIDEVEMIEAEISILKEELKNLEYELEFGL